MVDTQQKNKKSQLGKRKGHSSSGLLTIESRKVPPELMDTRLKINLQPSITKLVLTGLT